MSFDSTAVNANLLDEFSMKGSLFFLSESNATMLVGSSLLNTKEKFCALTKSFNISFD